MTFRKPSRHLRTSATRRDEKRRSLMENLENRQLLAGPELIGIQNNEGNLLDPNDVLLVSPRELVFRFDDNTQIDADTLDAIRITRAGEDGTFESARVNTDFGTSGVALFEFRALQSGSLGNGITINITSSPRGASPVPVISQSATNRSVTIDLNSDVGTQAGFLISAITTFNDSLLNSLGQPSDPSNPPLIELIQNSGASQTQILAANIAGTTLTLDGANAAQGVTDFGSSGQVRVRLISQVPGQEGLGTNIVVERVNFGGAANPVVVVSGQTVRVQLNSFAGSPTTAQQFVDAINSNPQANVLVQALIQEGNAQFPIANQPVTYSPIPLSGVSDVVLQPGFIGLGDSSREVVFRFAETLPDDEYQIDILGSGTVALRGEDGEAFEDGTNFSQKFSLNLGPQIVAVVPEPVRRRTDGTLSVDTGKIEVHFNNDDLDPLKAQNADQYQLIFTRDTINNQDDEVFRPVSPPVYNSITNIVTLDFGRSLARFQDPDNAGLFLGGTARLRVGFEVSQTPNPNDAAPVGLPDGPTTITVTQGNGVDPAGDNFVDAYSLNSQWVIDPTIANAQSVSLTSEIRNETAYGLEYPSADYPGTRNIRPDDPSRLDRVVPLDYLRQGADSEDGITTIEYDFAASWLGDDPNSPGTFEDTIYNNIISEQQKQRTREVLTLFSEYLGITFIEVADRDPADIGGFSIAVGDLYGGDERAASDPGGLAVVLRDRDGNGVDDLVVLDFQDFDESTDDQFGGEFFRGAMFGVGQLLGYGYADDLPQPTTQSTDFIFQPGTDNEPAFPSYADIVHGQYLYRPDSTDVDLYSFTLTQPGSVTVETIAERLATPSLLDTQLRLYRQIVPATATDAGVYELLSQNDDYFSNDSLIRGDELGIGTYVIGVSARGNDTYDPYISGTGLGGLSQGEYELRVDFTPLASSGITDATGIALDGDSDGLPGGTFNYWLKPSDPSETLYVDKGNVTLQSPSGSISNNLGNIAFVEAFQNRSIGSALNPYSEIDEAVEDASRISVLQQQALSGTFTELNQLLQSNPNRATNIYIYLTGVNPLTRDIENNPVDLTIRVVGNGGRDGRVETVADNFSYNIGFQTNGLPLQDGADLELPANVQMVFDAGAIIKMSNQRIGVGSVAPTIDLSGSNLQILGTPTIVTSTGLPARDSSGSLIAGSVILTSINDSSVGTGNQVGIRPAPGPGDWGGIDFRGDLDSADELRVDLEDAGVFVNHIQYGDFRYGGGIVSIGGRSTAVSPIDMAITRATIINSRITDSADAAISATPDTFREDRYTFPKFQENGAFTPDYERIGPEIHGNFIADNTINGLFVRLANRSGSELERVNTNIRFDDSDITHVLTENLVINGTPGGPIRQSGAPASFLVRTSPAPGDGSILAGTYVYRLTNVDNQNLESAASDNTVQVTTTTVGGIRLIALPTPVSGSGTVARRLYRAPVVNGTVGSFLLVGELNASSTTYTDRVQVGTRLLQDDASPLRSRLDASLVIDEATVLKVDGARIEARFGASLIAEGSPDNPVVITSLEDQRYGAGGSFDTNSAGSSGQITPGDWGGIYIGHGSKASLDNAVVAGGGGTTRIEGGFASFNAIEVHQGELRLTNSRIENNADGRGVTNGTREGRSDNASGALFVRASTPIIIDNDFVDNDAAAISIDLNSLNSVEVADGGRSTGALEAFDIIGNSGPLVQDNSTTRNAINGMAVRGGQLVTEGVWDDVSMVHVVTDSIEIPNKHIFGGLRLVSDARGSLVVKFNTENAGDPAGLVVGGSLLTSADEFRDIPDRIGGSLQLVGHPDFPVVLTSLQDDFAGAGFTIDGFAQLDTNNDGTIGGDLTDQTGTLPTGPEVNLGTTIDNDVDQSITGSFGATIGNANEVGIGVGTGSTVTVDNLQTNQQLIAQDFIFQYNTYLISAGATTSLAATTITQPATLVGDDVVESRGTYTGPNGAVDWIATSFFPDGVSTLFTSLELSSTEVLGDIRVVSYLDEDVLGIADDVMYTVGTPGQSDFRIYTIDGSLRVGFSHGGFYANDGQNQQNATYEGWAADQFPELDNQIIAGTQLYSIPGEIDLTDLPASPDVTFGTVWGPADVATAHSWIVDPTANSAEVTSFLELLAADPVVRNPRFKVESGNWNGVVVREGAGDRNVVSVAEQEPVRTTVYDTNSFPGQAQFLGELAPDEQSGDENRRLGFVIDGAITTRDDLDVFSFVAESGTEVWLDIDRTSNSLDTVIELIDFNGEVLALNDNSLDAEKDPNTGLFVSPRLDDDAAQPLTVTEQRLQAQQIIVDPNIENATSGSISLGIIGSTTTAVISAADFNADPAGSVETALNSTFANELGPVTAQLLPRSATGSYIVEVKFSDQYFTGRAVPQLRGTSNPVVPAISEIRIDSDVPVSVLQDTYSTNTKDAGMRIRLPGEVGTRNLYHIRVRSSNTRADNAIPDLVNLNDANGPGLLDGLTRGRYSLQVRLQETDESPGTQVRLADVRYATTGIQVIGQPLRSPLLGEEAERDGDNNSATNAQPLGYYGTVDDASAEYGPLQSDRLAKSIAGTIDSATDVDWYQFEVRYENLTRDGAPLPLSTIIDLDYASNFARSDMAFHVFDETGALIYTAADSNIAGDLPVSLTDNSTDDLSRGSTGTQDPFLGSVELSEGTYYLAIANQTQSPTQLDQFFSPASTNPLVRLFPIQATDLVVADSFSNRVLFDEGSLTPYSLDDVVLYVNTANGLNVVNPFTGENYGLVGGFGSEDIYDVAFRSNGELMAYTQFGNRGRGDNNWQYVQIDTGTATPSAAISLGAGITTYGDAFFEIDSPQFLDIIANEGIEVEAITIREYSNNELGFFVGNRLGGAASAAGVQYTRNILYDFSPDTGLARGPSYNRFLFNSGAGTIPRELGRIDTTAPATARATQLGIPSVSEILPSGQRQQQLFDGDVFTLVVGQTTTTFEIELTSDILVSDSNVIDGDTLTVGTTEFEFDTGPRLRIGDVSANGGLDIGQNVTVTDLNGVSQTFEFVNQGNAAQAGNIAIVIRRADGSVVPATQIARTLSQQIELALPNVNTTLQGTEIAFDAASSYVFDGVGMSTVGLNGVSANAIPIIIDESASASEILNAIVTTLNNSGIQTTTNGLSFAVPGAGSVIANSAALIGGGTAGVDAGRIAIQVAPTENASQISQKVADAINNLGGNATAIAQLRGVAVSGGFIVSPSGNLVAGGIPTGGLITGIEILGDDLYGLDENGGLYLVAGNQVLDGSGIRYGNRDLGAYVESATDLLRLGERFTGLRAGPNSVDGGLYADILFGITQSGNIYAFNTAGELQPYFAGGRSSIATGIQGAEGLDFSTLDYNLWHFTGARSADPGHGNVISETSIIDNPGTTTSLAFTYEASFQTNYDTVVEYPTFNARRDGQGVNRTYNFPGGAKGEVQSKSFSLASYSPSDQPMLYFNYRSEADGGDATDALRIYVVQPDGTEHAVALNTTGRGSGSADDEFDDPDSGVYFDTIDLDKQQLFDNTTTWRQARVPLADFAGQSDLTFRIEFATAGTLDTGSPEIRTVAAADLVEGQELIVNRERFAVNFPPTLIAPAGSIIADAYAQSTTARAAFTLDGQTYVLDDGTRVIDGSPSDPNDVNSPPNEIAIDLTSTGAAVADLTAPQVAAIIASVTTPPTTLLITDYDIARDENAIEFGDATTLVTASATLMTARNVSPLAANPIELRAAMTPNQVATAIQAALMQRFFPASVGSTGGPNYIPTSGATVSVPGFTVNDFGPFANTLNRFADQFGATPVQGARTNDFEGIFLDDFVVGLAERGERVIDPRAAGAGIDSAFVTDQRFAFANPDDPRSDTVTGSYQVEIRDGSEYEIASTGGQFRSFDSNDRLDEGVTIEARSASQILDGQFFTITDGRATVEFEFDSNNDVTPGRVGVAFSMTVTDEDTGLPRPQTATEVAGSIIQAINRSDVRSVLDVLAVPSAGFQTEIADPAGRKQIKRIDPRINLVGNIVVSDNARVLADIEQFELRGDKNRDRDAQGVILIESSRFLFNQDYGVDIARDVTTNVAGNTTPTISRYPRNLVELNTEDLVPGVVVQSNVFAFNSVGGIQLQGIDSGLQQTTDDPVSYERIVNNTIIGGSVSTGPTAPADTFEGVLFPSGRVSFADAVIAYDPSAGSRPPATIHQDADTSLGVPDCLGRGPEPIDGQFSVSLGVFGSLTVQFVDNFLTGSGDSQNDLAIFETGEIESVSVEISRDGINFFDVGTVGGLTNQIDIDAFGYGPNDRFSFVRLTDLGQGNNTGGALGADIDAVGAISSVPVDLFTPGGTGINIVGDASPAILNNVISNSIVGIEVQGGNNGFVSGANAFYQNTTNATTGIDLGILPQFITPSESIFVDPGAFVFSPAAGSRIIDSSIDSLPERSSLTTVRDAVGIPQSPILAPRLDVSGQLRVDDPNVEPPGGLGERIFKDRGGFDRGDSTGPRITLLSPLAPRIGENIGRVTVIGNAPDAFEIQLIDGIPPADNVPGTGIDDRSVANDSLVLLKDGVPQVEGINYRFAYNPSTNIIRLTPIAGIWRENSTYVIRMVDSSNAIIRAGEGVIYDDGDQLSIIDAAGETTTFEYETGIVVTISGNLSAANADGVRFEVYDGNVTRTFELDNNDAVSGLGIPVEIPAAGQPIEFAQALADAINLDTQLSFTATVSGTAVQLTGGTPLSSVISSSGFAQVAGRIGTDTGFGFRVLPQDTSNVADVADGQSITIRLGLANATTFEFDNDGLLNDPLATAVTITDNASIDDLVNELVRVIGGASLGLAPTNAGFGRIFLGGDSTYSLSLNDTSFEAIALPGQGPTVPIEIPIDQSAEQIIRIIRDVIDAQDLPGVDNNITDMDSIVDVRLFLSGTQGVSGVGAVDTVVVQDQVGNLLQPNQADGRTELTIFVGQGFDFGDAPGYITERFDGPLDASGNPVGGARHVVDPGLGLGTVTTADSDAELPNADSGDDGVSLPAVFQSGFTEQISIFLRNQDAGQVTDNPVYVDAWFDWDQDGEFEDNEQVRYGTSGTNRTPIASNLLTTVAVVVPSSALSGNTYARFRVSESPFTGPFGIAPSADPNSTAPGIGEVEDYEIFVSNNPFQNPSDRLDVNASNQITPLDALQVINALARDPVGSTTGQIDLQTTPISSPRYPDVNGDGFVTIRDALDVITALGRLSGSGEGEGLDGKFVAAAPGVFASASTTIGDALINSSGSDFLSVGSGSHDTDEDGETADLDVSMTLSERSVSGSNGGTSVFDSAGSMGMDSFVDELALDTASADNGRDDSLADETGALDSFFASL